MEVSPQACAMRGCGRAHVGDLEQIALTGLAQLHLCAVTSPSGLHCSAPAPPRLAHETADAAGIT